jgi:hypothetical protein
LPRTTTTYDALGRPVLAKLPESNLLANNPTIETRYSAWTTTLIDSNKYKRETQTDPFRRLIKVIEWSGDSSITYANYAVTEYQYNVLNQLTVVKDKGNNETRIEYDDL